MYPFITTNICFLTGTRILKVAYLGGAGSGFLKLAKASRKATINQGSTETGGDIHIPSHGCWQPLVLTGYCSEALVLTM